LCRDIISPNPKIPEKINALNLIHLAKTTKQTFNCWLYSSILNDLLLALGFKSRKIHIKPPKKYPKESHFINAVYSKSLSKWILVDADFCLYFKDENGAILGLEEIREKIVKNEPLIPSKEKQYNIGGLIGAIIFFVKRKTIRWYYSKNIFRFTTALYSTFDYESRGNKKEYLELMPIGYEDERDRQTIDSEKLTTTYTTNSNLFWEK